MSHRINEVKLKEQGLTLIELLIVIVVAAILLSLAAPSMDSLLKTSAIRAHQTDLLNSMNYARGEAVSRNKLVAMCASSDGASCDTTNNWSAGWLVFIDNGAGANSNNGILDAGEELLRAFEHEGRNTVRLMNVSADAVAAMSWNFRGFARHIVASGTAPPPVEAPTLAILCGPENDINRARAILVELSGRAIKSRDLDGDGVHDSAFVGSAGSSSISCS